MSTIKKFGVTVQDNLSKDELLKFMVANKKTLLAEKKMCVKESDSLQINSAVSLSFYVNKEGNICKYSYVEKQANENQTAICVINTTNVMDSHGDVHIPGIWNKSIADNKYFTHLQEHKMSFSTVISENSKGYTAKMNWSELNYNIPGQTEALVFETPFSGRNAYMEDQYRKGYVTNHSVGMQYVKIKMCINRPNDEYYKEEYANWTQYIGQVVNVEEAENEEMFWAVLEAKIIEGSAVVKGSNTITPFLGMKSQPLQNTGITQPLLSTENKNNDFMEYLSKTKLIN